MKRCLIVALLSLVALGTAGCTLLARKSAAPVQYRPRAFAIAITVNGVLQPTPQQWAAIQAKVVQELAVHGWILVSDLALADDILRIDFTPNPNNPENSGRATLIGIRPNPRLAIASTTSIGRYPTSFSSLGSFQSASWGYNGFSNYNSYGWGSSYYDGYSYGSSNLNPTTAPIPPTTRPTHPPYRPHPISREECPSPWDNRSRPSGLPDHYASRIGGDSSRTPGTGDRSRWRGGDSATPQPSSSYAGHDRTSWRSEGSASRSDSSGSSGERTQTRAEPSRSRIEYAQARSGSGDSSRPERTYSRSDSSDSRGERTYTRSEPSRSWQDRSDSSGSRSESSYSRPERSYSRSESSGGGSERSYSRSESSHSRSESSHSRSESRSRSESHSRSESSHSHSRDASPASSPASSPPPEPPPSSPEPAPATN